MPVDNRTLLRTIGEGADRLVLRTRGDVVEILAGNVVLLSSAALGTERAFGELAAKLIAPRRILVGGLGFGATVRAVLDHVGSDARVVVAEKVAAVEGLVRGELAWIARDPLSDARVTVVIEDVARVVAKATGEFDAILLDVDNGPHWASFRSNARLYTRAGLDCVMNALVPGGALAVWSGYRADEFIPRLRAAGFASSVVPFHENGRVRARAYVGRKRPRDR